MKLKTRDKLCHDKQAASRCVNTDVFVTQRYRIDVLINGSFARSGRGHWHGGLTSSNHTVPASNPYNPNRRTTLPRNVAFKTTVVSSIRTYKECAHTVTNNKLGYRGTVGAEARSGARQLIELKDLTATATAEGQY